MFPWSNSSVSLAETARRNTHNFVETRKKAVESLTDRFFTNVAKDIIEFSAKNAVTDMAFNITDPAVCKKVVGLADTTYQERYDILKKVVEKLQVEKFVSRSDGTVLHVSWEPELPIEQMAFYYDKGCPHCVKILPTWNEIVSKLHSKGRVAGIDVRDPSYEKHRKPVTAVPTIRIHPKGFAHHDDFVEVMGDKVVEAMIEFAISH